MEFPIGILTPDWLSNATYLGTEVIGNMTCYKWTKSEFVIYWEDAETRSPVRWVFLRSSALFDIIVFKKDDVIPDALWQTPDYCFLNGKTL